MKKNDLIFIIVIFCIVVLISSFIIIAKQKADSGLLKYTNKNGESFKLTKQKYYNLTFYAINIFPAYNGGVDYLFRYSPFDVEGIPIEKGVENALNRPKGIDLVYYTQDLDFFNKTDTDTIIAIGEFSRILGTNDYGIFKLNGKAAYTYPLTGKETIATCKNVSDTTAVIYVKEGENKIYSENGCLIIQGTKEDIVKVADRFAYYLANVVPA